MLEALCRGVPVIAAGVGGIPEWVSHDQSGVLLRPPARPAALARAIARLHDDRRLWDRLHAAAQRRGRDVQDARGVAARFLAATAGRPGVDGE